MKRIFTILASMAIGILLTASVFAQVPEKMSYQAVIRNSSDALVINTQIGMQISILQGSASGTVVYTETQTPTTNANGLVSIEIGTGTTSDNFSLIDWSTDTYFIKTETDPEGGTNYTITGISQLLSVPYALHAKTAETITGTITETDPIFNTSVANGITSIDTANWNAKVGYTDALVSANADVVANTAKTGITTQQASDITENNAKVGYSDALVSANADVVANSAKISYPGDQDISGITDNASEIATLQTEQTTQNTAIALNTAKTGITLQQTSDITANNAKVGYTDALVSANADVVANTAKTGITTEQADAIVTNSAKISYPGDQDISGITDNATDIANIQTEQTTQNTAIALNTAKVSYTDALVSANADVVANTAKISYPGDQDISGITDNASDIANIQTEQTTQNTAIALNTAKVGYSDALVSANADVVANSAKISYPGDQDISGITDNATDIATLQTEQTTQNTAIALNTAKTGITAQQASDITANNAKVGYTDALVSANADVVANSAKISYPGDQDISGITDNASDIANIQTEQTTQNTAIALNTAKTGYTDALVSANADVAANKTHSNLITGNPHSVTKTDIGLENVNNTADADKPVSTATQTALDNKVDITGNQTITGNKTFTGTTSVATPVNATDAANKAYVDALEAKLGILDLKIQLLSGVSIADLVSGGASLSDLVSAGVSVPDLLTAGVSATDLIAAGVITAESDLIGLDHQGGKIAYILQSGDPGYVEGETHGLIASLSDQSTGIEWYNGVFTTIGTTETAIGTGQANTTTIIANQGAGSYAAQVCADLVIDIYDDWYLPSLDELKLIYPHKTLIGGFIDAFYWSSSEYSNTLAHTKNMGSQNNSGVSDKSRAWYALRAIRSF
jgi:phage antirepressor YoqD-like protein